MYNIAAIFAQKNIFSSTFLVDFLKSPGERMERTTEQKSFRDFLLLLK
jgi:hypothetical protein